ncbi:MAG TPA: hypothetical protein VMR98_04295, partial [Candidatus Polarisedimenticolaceae bacterium]|nr:hypothetical protein [Candidatus Polarisedimenticolaceae bacterium]
GPIADASAERRKMKEEAHAHTQEVLAHTGEESEYYKQALETEEDIKARVDEANALAHEIIDDVVKEKGELADLEAIPTATDDDLPEGHPHREDKVRS